MSIRLLLPLLALGGLAWLGLAERGEDGPPPAPALSPPLSPPRDPGLVPLLANLVLHLQEELTHVC